MRQVTLSSCIAILAVVGIAACSGSSGDTSGSGAGSGVGAGVGTGSGGGSSGSSCAVTGAPTTVSDTPGSTPSLAWNGSVFGLAWSSANGDEVRAAVLGANGTKIHETSLATGANIQQPRIYAEKAGTFLVLWSQGTNVVARRIDATGNASGAAFTITQTTAAEPHARGAIGPNGFIAAWDAQASGALGLVSGGSLVKSVALQGGAPAFPAPASDGTRSGVFWSAGHQIEFAAVDGSLGLGQAATIPGDGTNKSAVVFGGAYFVAWEDVSNGDGAENVYVAKVGGSGNASQGIAVPSNGGSANWPSIAADGKYLGVTYYQFRDGPPSIFLALFTSDLTRVGEDLQVSPDNEADRFPSIAWAGDEFGVAYAQKQGPVKLSLVTCQ